MALNFKNLKSKLIKTFDHKAEKQTLTLYLELAPLALTGRSFTADRKENSHRAQENYMKTYIPKYKVFITKFGTKQRKTHRPTAIWIIVISEKLN